jgi:hypothetical protein
VLHETLLPLFAGRNLAPSAGEPVVFGLPPLPAGFVARPEAMAVLQKALLGSRLQVGVVAAAALYGIGGLGKTVLARAAWADPTIRAGVDRRAGRKSHRRE